MSEFLLFYVLFISQIFLISLYYARKISGRIESVFENYPPQSYPKLYPKPMGYYKNMLRNFRLMNTVILIAGLLLVALLASQPRSGEWDKAIVTWYFLLQFSPALLLELKTYKQFKLMRNARSRTTRKAVLQPRRLVDFLSPPYLGAVVITYIAFALLIVYVDQFDYPWFGGYANIAGVTVLNLFFGAIIYRRAYGKKLNPHQSHDDRIRQTAVLAKVLALTSIAATVFIALSIVLSALELQQLRAPIQCLYFQLLAVISFQAYRMEYVDFDVYKADAVAT